MSKTKHISKLIGNPMSFCPGCGHGIIVRIITDCLRELEQDDNIIFAIGVGCSSLIGGGIVADRRHCAHGRAGAVATAMKRVSPHNIILAYQGDGDAYSIGLAETTSAAYRGENITTIVVNNTNYGMTGGQMSATTLPQQRTSTSVSGRDCNLTGNPICFPELVAHSFDPAFAARGSLHNIANINKTKNYIKKALQAQINGDGYSIVEVLSPCPTNWGMTALKSMKHVEEAVSPFFPLGVFADKGGKK